MTIDKLKIEGGQITVDYHGLAESFRISTCDEAKPDLYKAAAQVAIVSRVCLGLAGTEGAGFFAIAFSRGDRPGTRLVLSMPTAEGEPAKIACPKIDRGEIYDAETGLVNEAHPRTILERSVAVLEHAIESFVLGKRMQMALPFDQSPEERELTREVQDFIAGGAPAGSEPDAAGRVLDFQAGAQA